MELFAADGHDAGGCERVTGKSGMRPSASSRLFGVDAPETILYGFFIGGLSSLLNTPD